MNICYVSYEYPPQFGGGIGTYVGVMSKNLAEAGHRVDVITFNPGVLPESEVIDNVHIHRISMTGPQMEIINNAESPNLSTLLYWTHYSEKVFHKLKELSEIRHIHVAEFCDYRGEGYFSMLAKKTRSIFRDTAMIIRLHTPLFVLNPYNGISNADGMEQLVNFENSAMLFADHIVSPTKILANLSEKELDLKQAIPVLPHPIDVNAIQGDRYTDSETILYVGRLETRKGVIDLVKALVELLPSNPSLRAKLIGGDTLNHEGKSVKSILLSIVPDTLKDRILFIDRLPREEVLKEYLKSKFCVFPSLFENFPNVCLEAMSSSAPVIVSDNSGMAEMIDDGVSGFVFKAGDVDDLISKILSMLSLKPEDRLAMGRKARIRVEERYSKDVINKNQELYFQSISSTLPLSFAQGDYEKGLVSVVIPCYNHGEFIHEAIQSVLDNTYKKVEIIVVNDGSTDNNTNSILESLPFKDVKVIHQKNAGLSAARNTGIAHARGEYIFPLDADDKIEPTMFEKSVHVLEKERNVGFVYTHVKFFGVADGIWKTPEFDPNLILVSNLCVAASMFRHIAFDQVGGYKLDMIYGYEDWDFWIYLVEYGWKGYCIPEPLFLYRKHDESMLFNSQKHRPFLIEKLVEHHKATYQRALNYVIVEKDRQFYQEHMSNYMNYQQLNSIINSKAWKLITTYRKIKDKLMVLRGRK